MRCGGEGGATFLDDAVVGEVGGICVGEEASQFGEGAGGDFGFVEIQPVICGAYDEVCVMTMMFEESPLDFVIEKCEMREVGYRAFEEEVDAEDGAGGEVGGLGEGYGVEVLQAGVEYSGDLVCGEGTDQDVEVGDGALIVELNGDG